jgi:hypothetical protein
MKNATSVVFVSSNKTVTTKTHKKTTHRNHMAQYLQVWTAAHLDISSFHNPFSQGLQSQLINSYFNVSSFTFHLHTDS